MPNVKIDNHAAILNSFVAGGFNSSGWHVLPRLYMAGMLVTHQHKPLEFYSDVYHDPVVVTCAECGQVLLGTDEWPEFINLNEKVNTMLGEWQPIETCPSHETVLFWDNGYTIGRMEHNCLRMDGTRQDHFWGAQFDDNNPPSYWTPLPEPPRV